MISIWVIAACWHQLRSDEIALIVLSYRVTECKNKRHKQVRHCLLKMYKQAVISVSKICNCKPAHLPMLARPAINPFNIEPSPNPLARNTHLSSLCKQLFFAPEQPSFAPNQPLFNGVLRQTHFISGKPAQGVKKTRQSAIYSSAMVHQVHFQALCLNVYILYQCPQYLFVFWRVWT